MCGRWDVEMDDETAVERFRIDRIIDHMKIKYSVAIQSEMPLVYENDAGERELKNFRWSLRRKWWEKGDFQPFNARAETVAKGMFKEPLETQRCLVPANGYYEWVQMEGYKQPYRIHPTDQENFAFAGLYDYWNDGEKWIGTYTIITTSPAESIAHIHNRMPVILHPEDEDLWLSRDVQAVDAVLPLLRTYESDALTAYKVDRKVNSSRVEDSPDLIEPLPDQDE